MKIIEQIFSLINEKVDGKNRNYILIGVFAGILMIDYFAITMWQLRAFSTIGPKASALSKDLKQAQDDVKKSNQYQAQVNQLKSKMRAVEAAILPKEEIPVMLDNISSLAKESGVKINQIAPLREQEALALSNGDGKYFMMPISVHAKGGYHNLGRFFSALENNSTFMGITDFSITASGDDLLHHQLILTIKTFVSEKIESPDNK